MTKLYSSLLLAACSFPLGMFAQPGRTTLLAEHIHTLRAAVDGEDTFVPVVQLGGGQTLEFSFDDFTHEYRRYTYRVEHCDYEGRPTEDLFSSDYVTSGDDEEVIDSYEPSQNTSVLYNHYSLAIPSSRMRILKSGNYRLTISTENDEGETVPVIRTYFGVVDPQIRLSATCTTNTDVDWNGAHQQLSVNVDMGSLVLRDAGEEYKLVILQNGRYDNRVVAPRPTSQSGQQLIWDHSRELIFDAGNEFRKMEFLSHRYPGMHGESMKWFEPYYHYILFPDTPRRNYLYDEDQNGISVVRTENSSSPETEADYALVHFVLQTEEVPGATLYVDGRWASGGFQPATAMHYDAASGQYEAAVLLKQGYYNYQYLAVPDADGQSGVGSTVPVEGNYYQTENEYTFLSYYRATGDRYWQMVGNLSLTYRKR